MARHCGRATHRLKLLECKAQQTRGVDHQPADGKNTNDIQQDEERRNQDNDHQNSFWAQIDAEIDAETRPDPALRSLADELETNDHIQQLLNGVSDSSTPLQSAHWLDLLEAELEALQDIDSQDEAQRMPSTPSSQDSASTASENEWYPFRSKMELIGSLIVGHTHSMLSRSLYSKIRGILTMCDVHLPAWATIQAGRACIQQLLKSSIRFDVSVFDNPCFSLSARSLIAQDLANPLVSKHLDYYPHMTEGRNIYKFSQSRKWLELLAPAHRAPMCELTAKCLQIKRDHISHISNLIKIVIPGNLTFHDSRLSAIPVKDFEFDYSEILMENRRYLIDACGGVIYESSDEKEVSIPLPNPWRIKAHGRVIRHVPITLYSDDTSGNSSKQFNKHISFYFTLSGLPPNVSNQEYNCLQIDRPNPMKPTISPARRLTAIVNDSQVPESQFDTVSNAELSAIYPEAAEPPPTGKHESISPKQPENPPAESSEE
ncbi:hypothetical protein PCANC_27603 [Puccinia coronata f. sp. avenae]|uniref:Uncharacterized protein n=1 Tax=Puccinia coronata f. sp. avenae TaxID=200324 RepID=A0A2N5TLE8_9BASI|nr:hypothetical protein PCANC_27603 [Puccinia coronata f. sp. avenae]